MSLVGSPALAPSVGLSIYPSLFGCGCFVVLKCTAKTVLPRLSCAVLVEAEAEAERTQADWTSDGDFFFCFRERDQRALVCLGIYEDRY